MRTLSFVHRLPLLAVCLIAFIVTACGRPATIVTDAGKTAYAANEVVLRINELQATAIQAEAGGALDTATTRKIVEFSVSANRTLKAAPSGWQATVSAAWEETKKQLPAITNPALVAAMGAVDIVLTELAAP